ncbi:AraC family transcriptional regulator [Puia dinghuensis]|uniref:Transcriptional regulator n=1 Tax=Puia dinghuensis TaxID=1792502 RepID=A0A8J2UDW9_9BACT|nr:AraC family transcriptional regulator [Puia dinghuensis]GGB02413.1 transcriptional regulator [Puia dinghuensis]
MQRQGAIRKRQGFKGQKLIVLPKKITTEFLTRDPVTRQIYITDIGYYPKAAFHYVDRPAGIGQHIIIYCMEGSGWIVIGGKRIELGPSQFITIPANSAHKYGANENDPWTIYWFHFKGEIASFVVDLILQRSRTGGTTYQPALTYDENRIKLFEEIYANLEKGYGQDNLRYVNMIFYHFLSSLLYEDKFSHTDNRQADDIIARTIQQMQRKIHTVTGLKAFADFANLSVSHFSAVFKEQTGYAPVEYFNHLKIQKACQYLLLTQMTVKEIAGELGIDDQYYFSRMFSRLMGYSPLEYRKRNRSAR